MRSEVRDYIDRRLRLAFARKYLEIAGVSLVSDPTPFPFLHLFPRVERAARPVMVRLRRRGLPASTDHQESQ